MHEHNLDRIRDDLKVMQQAMGGPAYGPMDARFLVAESLAAVSLAICLWLGADTGWPLLLSGMPLIVVTLAYLGYFVAKSLPDSDVSVVRRKEYRTSLLIVAPVALVALVARQWAFQAGMTYLQFGGAICVVMGSAFVLLSATNSTHNRYPRWMWCCLGIPLVLCGLIIPFCTKTQAWISVSIMGAAAAASIAVLIHKDLAQRTNETSNAAD